jgi:hypothetical protein
MRSVIASLLFAFTSTAAICQQSNPVAIFLGVPTDLSNGPATFNLIPKEAGARTGKVWVRYADDGLHIHGEVNADPNDVHWPAEKKDMLSSDHVEVWLSTTASVDLPPIGYGNQFGMNEFKSPADCAPADDNSQRGDPSGSDTAACRRWYADQLEYRNQFVRLFARQWLTAGSADMGRTLSSFEDYATSAWNTLSADYYTDELPDTLKPKPDDGFKSSFGRGTDPNSGVSGGYVFDILIPWGAFPPSNELNLHYLWLMIDVYAHAPDGKKMGALSTTSPDRVWGKPSTFNHLILNLPRHYTISPCQANPTLTDISGDQHAAWYFPADGAEPLVLSKVFDIENPVQGYMYAPSGVSPIVRAEEQFWKTLADGSSVCGPQLAYRKGKIARASKIAIVKKYFNVKQLDDGWLMVRSGPDMSTQSPLGTGACGSCPVVDFDMYTISPTGEVATALEINQEFTGDEGQPADGDFAIAEDWSKIVYYERTAGDSGDDQDNKWSSTTYCLAGHVYKKCGEQKNVKRPDPPNFKLQLDQ